MFKVSVIGASGYSGIELVKLLASRDDVIIEHIIANSSAGQMISGIDPSLLKILDIDIEKYTEGILNSTDIVFLSLPAGESMKIIPELYDSGIKIIDLGGDFRLKNQLQYRKYYNNEHISPQLLNESVYGLSELYYDDIKTAKLIANPGCFATGIILSLMPALKHNLISGNDIVINSLSGVSGAGKKESFEYSFCEINENIRAYKITEHQHIPEIEQSLEHITGHKTGFTFIPHLAPVNRGIYTTITAGLSADSDIDSIYSFYDELYSECNFIRVTRQIPQLKNILQTNFCDIFLEIDKRSNKLIIISVLDNLLKGASGQAVQNMNIMLGLNETTGLLNKEKLYV